MHEGLFQKFFSIVPFNRLQVLQIISRSKVHINKIIRFHHSFVWLCVVFITVLITAFGVEALALLGSKLGKYLPNDKNNYIPFLFSKNELDSGTMVDATVGSADPISQEWRF